MHAMPEGTVFFPNEQSCVSPQLLPRPQLVESRLIKKLAREMEFQETASVNREKPSRAI
jgi:hypothetical protein